MATSDRHITRRTFAGVGTLSLVLLLATALYCWADGEIDVAIDVAPNVLNQQNQGEVVTVHTDLAYSSVVGATVSLNGVEIAWWKMDNQGNFVAKFTMAEIKALADVAGGLEIGAYNTLTLAGFVVKDGVQVPFVGTDQILVINNVPAGKK